MNENSLAMELLHEMKRESRRRFIIIIVLLSLLVLTNVSWLIAWNLPNYETESYDLQGDNQSNVIFSSGQGEVKVNGKN